MAENNNHDNPRVFISYSWDSPEHKLWVESFAQELRKAGIDARLDAWRDESQSIDDFMMIELERADFVLAICTPQYKRKIVENAEGGTTASGFEMGTAAALRRTGGKDVIPVLRSGTWLESAPSSLVSYRFYDFTLDDVSEEFAQLRDRLLGHVRRPPELGPRSGPAATPRLPDIFEGGPQPRPASESRPADTARAAPPAEPSPQDSPPAPPSGSGMGKKLGWAGAVLVGLVVVWNLIPDGGDGGGGPDNLPMATPPAEQQDLGAAPVEEPAQDQSWDGAEAPDYAGTEEESPAAEEEYPATVADYPDTGQDFVAEENEPAGYVETSDPSAGWQVFSEAGGCYVEKQLGEQSWLQMGFDMNQDVFLLGTYDPAWQDIEVGKIYPIVYELDENPDLAKRVEATGHFFGDVQGVYITSDDLDLVQGLAQRHLLSFYWDEDPYTDYWVMDADLRGSTIALQNLIQCQEELIGSQ